MATDTSTQEWKFELWLHERKIPPETPAGFCFLML